MNATRITIQRGAAKRKVIVADEDAVEIPAVGDTVGYHGVEWRVVKTERTKILLRIPVGAKA